MDNKDFGKVLEARTKQFAIDIIKMSSGLPSSPEGLVIRNQVTKSGTSIGANYREANRSRSKAEFVSRIRICESESSETAYCLEIIEALNWANVQALAEILKEVNELLAIFSATGKTLKL